MAIVQRVQGVTLCFAFAASVGALAQNGGHDEIVGGPLAGPMPFVNAPFSADAITTVRHTLRDGTRLEHSTTARYYRDSAGRVRVEVLTDSLGPPNTTAERRARLIVYPMTVLHRPAPLPTIYTVDAVTRTVPHSVRSLRSLAVGGGNGIAVPIGSNRFLHFARAQDLIRYDPFPIVPENIQRESLGTRRIAGVETTGHRLSLTVPPLVSRTNAPIDLVDEQWESPELGLIVYARYSDSNGGITEYRLTNIRRGNPPDHLFVVPSDYALERPSGVRRSQDGRWALEPWKVERER
jgi:hypothetical protein